MNPPDLKEGAEEDDNSAPVSLFRALQTVETASRNGGTPLHIAAVFDSRRTIKVLLDLDVDVSGWKVCGTARVQ